MGSKAKGESGFGQGQEEGTVGQQGGRGEGRRLREELG